MEGNDMIFYTPEKQYPGMPHGEMCGDFMPFYWQGIYYLFYLYKYCVYVVETKDFVHFGKPYLALQNGSPEEQDWHIGTGSVFHHEGTFYFHYTGFCEGNDKESGKYQQVVMRAVSKDLKTWEKDKQFFFPPQTTQYGNLHWRDPHVIWNEDVKAFTMLITATEKEGAHLRSGCTAVYCSEDMRNWKHYKTIYAPRTYITHECHDCFQIGDWWYLTFSNYSKWWETRYRMAKNFDGPWQMPPGDDMFDGRQLYAAKTVTDGEKRYLVGWQSIREDCKDRGRCLWGGNLLVHELVQEEDGRLSVAPVEAVFSSFDKQVEPEFEQMQGTFSGRECSDGSLAVEGGAEDGFGWAQIGKLKEVCMLTAELTWAENTSSVGLMIHADGRNLKEWCQLRLEVNAGKMWFDHYGKIDGDQSYLEERPVSFSGRKAKIVLIVSGNIILAYVNGVALASRCYQIGTGVIGIYAEYGTVTGEKIKLLSKE